MFWLLQRDDLHQSVIYIQKTDEICRLSHEDVCCVSLVFFTSWSFSFTRAKSFHQLCLFVFEWQRHLTAGGIITLICREQRRKSVHVNEVVYVVNTMSDQHQNQLFISCFADSWNLFTNEPVWMFMTWELLEKGSATMIWVRSIFFLLCKNVKNNRVSNWVKRFTEFFSHMWKYVKKKINGIVSKKFQTWFLFLLHVYMFTHP